VELSSDKPFCKVLTWLGIRVGQLFPLIIPEKEKKMTVDFYLPRTGHSMMVGGLALVLNEMFRNMGLDAKAHDFFDDDESLFEFTVYGVRVTCDGMSDAAWDGFIASVESFCFERYGETPVVVEED